MSQRPLETAPDSLVADGGGLRWGLFAGTIMDDPVTEGAKRGTVRRWSYAAGGAGEVSVGAAVAEIGPAATAFAWAQLGDETLTWSQRMPLGGGAHVGRVPPTGAWRGRHDHLVAIEADGGLRLHVPVEGGHLDVEMIGSETTPAVLSTPTPAGGWNVTEKAAGYPVRCQVSAPGYEVQFDGAGWRDWTSGRQDRDTHWRWAAGGGSTSDGRPVGINFSTGMNNDHEGENLVWLDGRPHQVELQKLGPVEEGWFEGAWIVSGPDWHLTFEPVGVRAAKENLVFVSSEYVQPIGTFTGQLPDGDGGLVDVVIRGVTEDHRARW